MKLFILIISLCALGYATGKDTIMNFNSYCNCPGGTASTTPPTTGTTSCPTTNTPPTAAPDHTHPPNDHNHTTPELIAFSVASTSDFAPASQSRVPMNVEYYNGGKHFHVDNTFNAPVKGLYAFTFSAVGKSGKWAVLALVTQKLNGSLIYVAQSYDSGSGTYNAAGGSVMVILEVGEKVWLDQGGGGHLMGTNPGPMTLFTGELKLRLD